MDELKMILDVAQSMPAQVTGAISVAAILYTMWLRKRGVDITERTSQSATQIKQMDALIRQNGELQDRLIAVQDALSKQTKATTDLGAKVEELEALVRHYQRKCDTCPGPSGMAIKVLA